MLTVNGTEIKTYKLDSKDTIIIRIASTFNTLPKYLYEIQNLDLTSEVNIQITDILALIKKSAKKSMDFQKFLKKNETVLKNSDLDIKKDILYPWIAYNKELENMSSFGTTILQEISKNFLQYFKNFDEFEKFFKDLKNYKKSLEFQILENSKKDEEYVKIYMIFDSIEDGMIYTDFQTQRVLIGLLLDLKNVTILEIFNNVVLKETVPFAVCNEFYKIFKNFVPSEDWNFTTENVLQLKLFEKNILDSKKYSDFTDVKIRVEGDLGNETVKADMKLITEKGYLSKEEYIDRFLTSFNPNLSYMNLTENEVAGIFYFPQERFNTYVFSDLVMNDKIFSRLIDIDESVKASKKRTNTGGSWVYIHFFHDSTGHISAGISEKMGDRTDPAIRDEDPEIFPHGVPYIRVRAKARDKKSIVIFQEMLSKLMSMYTEKYNEIVSIYEKYIPDFAVVEEVEVSPLKKQIDIAPEIFVKNYSRYCQPDRFPTIVNDKEAKKYKKEGLEIMVFPREAGFEPAYPSDGKGRHNYVCLNPDFPHPGLQVNNLSNSDQFPYIPCCFKVKQSDKNGGHFKHYFEGEELEQKTKKQQELISTDKFLEKDKYGLLPPNIQKLFEILDMDGDYKYIRLGVQRGESSFLNAVMVGLHETTGILDVQNTKIQKVLEKKRKELSGTDIRQTCKQSIYDMDDFKVEKDIKNPKNYFDPKLYLQMLEYYFDCNIFLFDTEKMVLPKYSQSYYKNVKISPCIFILEHWGSESDRAKYPQCELIVKWNTKKRTDTIYSFDYESKISRNINKVFKLLTDSYALGKEIRETKFPYDTLAITGQKIDGYGKCRGFNLNYGSKNISCLCSPMQPLPVPVSSDVFFADFGTARGFLEEFDFGIESVSKKDGKITELNTVFGNVFVSILVSPTEMELDLPISEGLLGYEKSEKKQSHLEVFNRNKKLARYITEYLFWIFSRYLVEKNIEEINDKILSKFSKDYFVIRENYEYGYIPKMFSENSSFLEGGKIIVQSEDMLKRMMYVLKLYTMRDLKTLREYHERKFIVNYYMEVVDFDTYENQVILEGEESIDKWIGENRGNLKLWTDVNTGDDKPYFLRNENLEGGKIFLVQRGKNLQNAIEIGRIWKEKGYNPGMYIQGDTEKSYGFTLYSWKGKNEVEKYFVKGEIETDIKILGYKIGNSPFYSVLLDLE